VSPNTNLKVEPTGRRLISPKETQHLRKFKPGEANQAQALDLRPERSGYWASWFVRGTWEQEDIVQLLRKPGWDKVKFKLLAGCPSSQLLQRLLATVVPDSTRLLYSHMLSKCRLCCDGSQAPRHVIKIKAITPTQRGSILRPRMPHQTSRASVICVTPKIGTRCAVVCVEVAANNLQGLPKQ
jgi:hypothetical protein